VFVFGVAPFVAPSATFLGVDAPASFGADTPLSFDWARDKVEDATPATNPPRIRAQHMARIFIFASMKPRTTTQIEMAPAASAQTTLRAAIAIAANMMASNSLAKILKAAFPPAHQGFSVEGIRVIVRCRSLSPRDSVASFRGL
jgi:hypothetical protein